MASNSTGDGPDEHASATSRRRFIETVGAGAVVGMAGLAGCTGGGGGDGGGDTTTTAATSTTAKTSTDGDTEMADTLSFYSWGGSTQEALSEHIVKPFEEEYGVTVEQSSFSSQDKMVANIRSSPAGSYDVVMPAVAGAYNAVQQDLLEPIRTENIDTWSNLLPVFQDFKVIGGSATTYVAPVYYGTVGMVYNTDYVSGSPPFSWQETFASEYKNHLTLEGFAFVRVFTTALALGMDPNQIKGEDGTYESGIKQVYDKMAEQHELVKTYWTSGQEQTTLYSNETAYLGDGWSGRILSLQEDGYDQLKYTIPEEGAYGWGDSFAIAKGSERRYTAEKFIEFAYQDSVMRQLSPQIGYPPATDVTSDAITALPDFDPTGGERLVFQDQKFKSEHQDDWSSTFQKIKLGQY
ncbi:MAG: PotD/PotF family extracellular solute-binding protein [Halanaeroarchaeum sp.]